MKNPLPAETGRRAFAFLRHATALVASLFAFCLLPAAARATTDDFGLCIRPHAEADPDAFCDRVIASGTKWVRMGLDWNHIETSKGVYNTAMLTKIDGIVNRLHAGGVNILWIIGYTATWASSQPTLGWPDATRHKPANWSDWEDHVEFVVTRYDGIISHWEVWNEPDHIGFWKDSVADYAVMLEKAHAKIKAVNPANVVLLGGLATTNGTTDSYGLGTFFDDLLALGAEDWFDVVNYHAYGNYEKHLDRHAGMVDVINHYGIQSKPIWITETGYTTVGNAALEVQKADMLNQVALGNRRLANADRVFWYCMVNPVITPANPSEENFGLLAPNLDALPAWWHYQAVGGAETDFAKQAAYPSLTAPTRTLYYVPTTTGDGSHVTASGNDRVIPATRYMYLRVNDGWLHDANQGLDSTVDIDVTYLDAGTGNFDVQYDSVSGAYQSLLVARANTGLWKTATFTVTNAKFANRQNNSSDLRVFAGGSALTVRKVAVRKRDNPGSVILQTNNAYKLILHAIDTDPTHIGYNPVTTQGGLECRAIEANNRYMFFRVSDSLVRVGDTDVAITVTFWDHGTDRLTIQYVGVGPVNKGVHIIKTGTNAWRTVTVTLNDAHFANSQSYHGDFNISNGGDGTHEYIRRVDVRRID